MWAFLPTSPFTHLHFTWTVFTCCLKFSLYELLNYDDENMQKMKQKTDPNKMQCAALCYSILL